MTSSVKFSVLAAAGLLTASCGPAAEPDNKPAPVEVNAAAEAPSLSVTEPPLDRAAMLAAVARAASAAALGRDDRAAQRELRGDLFEVRIRFGCPGGGPAVTAGPFNVRFEPESRTLRLRAAPDVTREEGWIAAVGGETVEAVEGFWMHRPWLLEAACLPQREGSSEGQPPGQRVGIAQFFKSTDPRTTRRDQRAYESTKVLEEGANPSADGYDVVLSGRLRELPDGRVIACHVARAGAPPDCVVSAEFDRVRFEQPGTGELIAEWRS